MGPQLTSEQFSFARDPASVHCAHVRLYANYTAHVGEGALIGQRVDGVVRTSDVPATGTGRSYLVEPEIASMGDSRPSSRTT